MATESDCAFSLMVVEDDILTRGVIVRMLGIKFPNRCIHVADNGKEALELFTEYLPDVVITDINMPHMDGIEMARRIKAIRANTAFIVVTAYGDRNYLEKFKEIGCCVFLMKPVDLKELFASVEKCYTEMRMRQE